MPRPSICTPQEKHEALAIYAMANGRADLTKQLLAEAGLGRIRLGTLRDWRHKDRDLYQQIQAEVGAYVRTHAAERFRAIASRAADVADEALAQLADSLKRGELDPKDLPRAAREAMTAGGISVDKSQLLTGQPTSIVDDGLGDIMGALASLGIRVFIGGQDSGLDTKPAAIDVQGEPPALPPIGDG